VVIIKMGFFRDFGNGFKTGFGKTLQVGGHLVPIPGLSKAGEAITKLHKGGKVPKTGNYRLMGGEVVLNRTQLSKIKKAKTAKGVQNVLRKVKAQKPKPMGKRRRKRR
jgi:hypothetical protein